MLRLVLVAALVTLVAAKPTTEDVANPTENLQASEDHLKEAREFLKRIDAQFAEWSNKYTIASWNYASNLTDENLAKKLNVSTTLALISKQKAHESSIFPWKDIQDEYIRRQFQKHSVVGDAALPEEMFKEFETIISQMENTYSTAKICDYKIKTKCDLELDTDLTEIMMRSRDPEELKYIWVEWRKASGEKVKSSFPRYVELANTIARLNNVSDYAAYWMKDYEAGDFPEQIETLWQQLKPLYLQLHAYVRRQLRIKYGDIVSKDGPIPAHLLGNMWAQTWANIVDFTTPFPGKELPDVTAALIEQGYNATSMFRLAESFFKSINLSAMPDTFWERSILTKQKDVEMICHASAWDFWDGKDFRIKQCTRVNMEDLLTAHHEMGHVEYYLQYKDQPTIFKDGANPGFHEAVGDVISLSASTPGHLRKIGLLKDETLVDNEAVLNHLYIKSLEKVVFLPFAYMMDRWRWHIFQGKVTPDNYNCDWWSLAEQYQGIEPPVDRSEDDFDPGAKYHIIANVEYIRYYVSFVIQFQFHKALCTKAKQYDPKSPDANPLHECDIYESKEAGNLLKSMLELGSSKPWPDAMEKITNQRHMDSAGLLEYFKPLTDWLTEENKKTNEYIGWVPSSKRCVQTRGELIHE